MNSHTHYEILGLRETATAEDIKKRYHDLARRFHPDVAGTGNATRFRAIQDAYAVLSDPAARQSYDATLPKAGRPAAGPSSATATAAPPTHPGASPHEPQVDDVIAGKYRILREIARSNDVVYEAVDQTMGRRLAVKELVLPGNLTGTARRERIERFNREARAAGRLSHPNIVTVYDYGEDNGRYFIAMEYLEGGTLRDRIQGGTSLPPDEAIGIACQVLGALTHAHAHKVVHRDVKPDNIHIQPDGQVKLTDFGIARLTEEASLTGDGQVFGTPSYMSPEQIEGRGIDLRSDLFSLGVVLYEMLSGHKPFTGDSVVSITYNIMHAEPPPMTGMSFAVEQVVMRSLCKDPHGRFQSAEEMRRALRTADTTPALFLTSSMNTGGTLYGQTAAVPYTMGTPGTITGGYGMPSSPPVGGPFGAPQHPAPAPQAGPFATWGQPPAPAPPPPPGFGRQRAPRRAVGPGTRAFFSVLMASLVISGVVIGFMLLFVRSYSQYQTQAGQRKLMATLNSGSERYNVGDLDGAASAFDTVLRQDRDGTAGRIARTNLAITLNKMGKLAYERGDLRRAEEYFGRAQDLYANPNDVMGDKDQEALDTARQNLQATYNRLGVRADASGGGDSGPPGLSGGVSSGDTDASLRQRMGQAQSSLQAGNQAYQQGNMEQARKQWLDAVNAAPGSPAALEAQQNLDRTSNSLEE